MATLLVVGRTLSGPPGEPDKARPTGVVRAASFATIDAACEHGARTQRDKDLGQTQLFGGEDDTSAAGGPMALPAATPWTEVEQLQHEKDALGLYWSGHPIDRYADALREYGAKSTTELAARRDGDQNGAGQAEISMGGIISSIRPLKTRRGDRMCVFTVDDAAGSLEVVVFPEPFKQYGHLVEEGRMVLVKGRCERDDETARMLASEIAPIDIVRERLASFVAIRLSAPQPDGDTFTRLWDVLMQHKGDRRVAIELLDPDRHLRVTLDVNAQIRVRPSERLVSEVEKICGAGSVSLR